MKSIFDAVNFRIDMAGEKLAIAIAQDQSTDEILMVAFQNKEALDKTIRNKTMHYFSTSRKKIWNKGEESGHVQAVKEIRLDCDGDALIFKVEQKKGACHEGYRTCFFRKLKNDMWVVDEERIFNPKDVY